MKILLLAAFLTTILSPSKAWTQAKIEEIEQYEIRTYDPQKSGLKDLVFEARIEKLTDILNKTKTFGELSDVYFKIYWVAPSQYKIEVMGLPKGFQEVRNDLSALIKGKLEFVIPERLSERFKGYTLKAEPVADGKLIRAIDYTYTMAVPEVDLSFDNNGRLKTIENRTVGSAVTLELTQTPKAWSNNKLVLDKVQAVSKQGKSKLTVTNSIEYTTIEGIGLPTKVTVKNVAEGVIPATAKEKEKKVKSETSSVITFTTYEVNKGKAQNFIMEGLRK